MSFTIAKFVVKIIDCFLNLKETMGLDWRRSSSRLVTLKILLAIEPQTPRTRHSPLPLPFTTTPHFTASTQYGAQYHIVGFCLCWISRLVCPLGTESLCRFLSKYFDISIGDDDAINTDMDAAQRSYIGFTIDAWAAAGLWHDAHGFVCF